MYYALMEMRDWTPEQISRMTIKQINNYLKHAENQSKKTKRDGSQRAAAEKFSSMPGVNKKALKRLM